MFRHSQSHAYVEVDGIIVDAEEVREDIINDIYAFATVVSPAAFGELYDVERASAEDIIRMALKRHIDLNKFRVRCPGLE